MRRIVIFAEDYGHEEFLKALVQRLAEEYHVAVKIEARSVRGGHGKVMTELGQFFRDLQGLPDLLVIATDANCKGHNERRREIERVDDKFNSFLVCAIPDPHVERWLLLDSAAFKAILGKGCSAPDFKCSRDRYKQLLFREVQNAGVVPLLGGLEYAEDIVRAMDLQRVEQADISFGKLLKDLQNRFRNWSSER